MRNWCAFCSRWPRRPTTTWMGAVWSASQRSLPRRRAVRCSATRASLATFWKLPIGKHAWRLRDSRRPTVEQLRQLIADDFDEGVTENEPPAVSQEPAAAPDVSETGGAHTVSQASQQIGGSRGCGAAVRPQLQQRPLRLPRGSQLRSRRSRPPARRAPRHKHSEK